ADQIDPRAALAVLKPVLEDEGVLKIAANLKFDWLVFARLGITCSPGDDVTLMSYALDAGKGGHSLGELAERWLAQRTARYDEMIGSGKARVSFNRLPIERAAGYAAEQADVTLRLWQVLRPRLSAERVMTVY